MIRSILILILFASLLCSAEPDADPRIAAVIGEFSEAVPEAEAAEIIANAETEKAEAITEARDEAVRDLKRLIRRNSDFGKQAGVYNEVLRLDRSDSDAVQFFTNIGTIEQVLADLEPLAEEDLLGNAVAVKFQTQLIYPAADWDRNQVAVKFGEAYPGLLWDGKQYGVMIQVPREDVYLHIAYVAAGSRPMDISLGGTHIKERGLAGVTGSWRLGKLAWESVGPLKGNGSALELSLESGAGPSPHLRGVVVSKDPNTPEGDPFNKVEP